MKLVETLAPGTYLNYNKVVDYIQSEESSIDNRVANLIFVNCDLIIYKGIKYVTKQNLASLLTERAFKEIQCNVTSIIILDETHSEPKNPIINSNQVKFITVK